MNAGIRIVSHGDGSEHVVVIDSSSEGARRELGAVAWSVLEALALSAAHEQGVWSAVTNARDLARGLGIGKDRAAAALGVLRRAGLVVAHTNRETTTSRFAASRYEVRLPVSGIDAPRGPSSQPVRSAPSRSRKRDPSTAETLDLFSTTT